MYRDTSSVDCATIYVNKLISKFGHLQPHILINLFKTYCCSFLDLVRGG